MLPATRDVDIIAEDEEKGIWLVRDKAKVQAATSMQDQAKVGTSSL